MSKKAPNPAIVDDIEAALKASEVVHNEKAARHELRTDDTVFNKHLPEGHTPDTVKELVDYTSSFAAAGVAAMGRVAADKLATNGDMKVINADISMGHMGSTSPTFFREKEVSIPQGKGEAPLKRVDVGYVLNSVEFRGGTNSAMMKEAKTQASALVADALK